MKQRLEKDLATLKEVNSILASLEMIGLKSILAMPVVQQDSKNFLRSLSNGQLQSEQLVAKRKLLTLINSL